MYKLFICIYNVDKHKHNTHCTYIYIGIGCEKHIFIYFSLSSICALSSS